MAAVGAVGGLTGYHLFAMVCPADQAAGMVKVHRTSILQVLYEIRF